MPFTLIAQLKILELKSVSTVFLSLGEGDQRRTLANGHLKVDGLTWPRSMTWDHVMAAETAISAIRFYIMEVNVLHVHLRLVETTTRA